MAQWSNLPNATLIDDIRKDAKARPEVWRALRTAEWRAFVERVAWRNTSGTLAWAAVPQVKLQVARFAIYALLEHPESDSLMRLTPDALRTIISTCDKDMQYWARMVLPAVIALAEPRQLDLFDGIL